MKIQLSKFRATCSSVLDRVAKTGEPVLVTRFGKPLVQILPPPPMAPAAGWLGAMKGTAEIRGDLVAPAAEPSDWEALE